jgi:nucleotidyltransferase substrate binding protein (TIGR01987 family)
MEELKQKYDAVSKALYSLKKALDRLHKEQAQDILDYEITRDSVIQRFEYSIELLWKFLKQYIFKTHAIELETGSPRIILREALSCGILTQEQFDLFIEAMSNRNLTSHTYNEFLAQEIVERIPDYYIFMKSVLDSIRIPA